MIPKPEHDPQAVDPFYCGTCRAIVHLTQPAVAVGVRNHRIGTAVHTVLPPQYARVYPYGFIEMPEAAAARTA